MTNEEKAWFAGIIDGEGCLTCGYRSDNRGIRLSLSLEMTHKPTIDKIKMWIPNMGYYRRVRKVGKTGWRIELRNKQAVPIVEMLCPYLITKREEANIWLLLADTVTNGGPNHKITETIKQKRTKLMSQLRALKRIDFT